jgi:hypothetical protein
MEANDDGGNQPSELLCGGNALVGSKSGPTLLSNSNEKGGVTQITIQSGNQCALVYVFGQL